MRVRGETTLRWRALEKLARIVAWCKKSALRVNQVQHSALRVPCKVRAKCVCSATNFTRSAKTCTPNAGTSRAEFAITMADGHTSDTIPRDGIRYALFALAMLGIEDREADSVARIDAQSVKFSGNSSDSETVRPGR